eukprot:COSAG01_NODE_6298_length_3748_cov_8.162510_1_plen_105_part_00
MGLSSLGHPVRGRTYAAGQEHGASGYGRVSWGDGQGGGNGPFVAPLSKPREGQARLLCLRSRSGLHAAAAASAAGRRRVACCCCCLLPAAAGFALLLLQQTAAD